MPKRTESARTRTAQRQDGGAARRVALGAAIRRARGDRSQSEVAQLLGVSQAAVSEWEIGGVELGLEHLVRIEDALGIDRGGLAVAAGYVDHLALLARRLDCVRALFVESFREARQLAQAGNRLGFGVRMWNLEISDDSDPDTFNEWWVVQLTDGPERG